MFEWKKGTNAGMFDSVTSFEEAQLALGCLPESLGWSKDTRVVVALSGGKDSVALLHAMQTLQKTHSFYLSAVHIDHAQHQASSIIASEVKAYTEAMSVHCQVFRLTCSENSSETRLREERYKAFVSLFPNKTWLLMGHHSDDDHETWWLNVLRGCGLHNLHGIPRIREHQQLTIFRPLLSWSREMIDTYHRDHHLPLWQDPSNHETHIARNFLRHKIIPDIKTFFPTVQVQINKLCERIRATQYWADRAVHQALLTSTHGPFISHAAMEQYPDSAQSDLVVAWIRSFDVHPSSQLIQLVLKHLKLKCGKDVYQGRTIFTAYGWSWIWHGVLSTEDQHYQHALAPEQVVEHIFGSFRANHACTLNFAASIRSAKIKRNAHHTSLKKNAQRLKIPKWLRGHWPVLIDLNGNLVDWWTPDNTMVSLESPSELGKGVLTWFAIISLSRKSHGDISQSESIST